MTKKKAKRGTAKKTKKKKTASKEQTPRTRKKRDPEAVRNEIAKIVDSGAKKITKAVMDQAIAGQLAPAKYLFEVASIYPASTDGSFSTVDDESLAKTLLRRLDLPDDPVVRDEEDPPKTTTSEEKPVAKTPDEGKEAESESGSEPKADAASKQAVLV